MPHILSVLLILFASMFTQSIAGFGSALISMPLLVPLIGVTQAAPLVAVVAFSLEIAMVLIYRKSLNIRAVSAMTVASLIAVPAGVYLAKLADEAVVELILGLILIGYALYALLKFKLPKFEKRIWSYVFGVIAGLLGGAYNTNGPPIIVFGTSRGWDPDEFRANLQGFFLVNNVLIIASHLTAGNLTAEVWGRFGLGLPVVALAVVAGTMVSKRIPAKKFRVGVLVVILVLGVTMVV